MRKDVKTLAYSAKQKGVRRRELYEKLLWEIPVNIWNHYACFLANLMFVCASRAIQKKLTTQLERMFSTYRRKIYSVCRIYVSQIFPPPPSFKSRMTSQDSVPRLGVCKNVFRLISLLTDTLTWLCIIDYLNIHSLQFYVHPKFFCFSSNPK